MFGGRPLFLKQAATLLQDGDDPATLHGLLVNSPGEALSALPEAEGFDPLWRFTYVLALERADAARPGARAAMEMAACWGGEIIPDELATSRLTGSASGLRSAFTTLTDRSLVTRIGGGERSGYVMHRLVAALVRSLASSRSALLTALEDAVSVVAGAVPDRARLRSPAEQTLMSLLAPHVAELDERVREFGLVNLSPPTVRRLAESLFRLGIHHWMSSEWEAAEAAYARSIELAALVSTESELALAKLRLANTLRQGGGFDEASALVQESMPLLAEGTDPKDKAWAMSVEARLLRHRPAHQPAEALALLEKSLATLLKSDRLDDSDVVRFHSELRGYLSVVYRQLSYLDRAEEEARMGLRIISGGMEAENLLATSEAFDEYLVATHLRSLGNVWRLQGRLRSATDAHRAVLRIYERVYRRDHMDVCRALDSLGRVQRERGETSAALEAFGRAGKTIAKMLGDQHANVATAEINRSLSLIDLSRPYRAYDVAQRGLQIYRAAYGEPPSIANYKNEATVWASFVKAEAALALGSLDEAVSNHGLVLEWRTAHLREGHAHRASSLFALAEARYLRDGDTVLDQIISEHRQALEIREAVFGTGPNYWVARSQARFGELTRDVALVRRALDYFREELVPGHWRTNAAEECLNLLT